MSGRYRIAQPWGRDKAREATLIDIQRIISEGDTVVVQARYRAIGKATGKVLDARVAHIWDLRAGKIIRVQQCTHTRQFADVTGMRSASTVAEL